MSEGSGKKFKVRDGWYTLEAGPYGSGCRREELVYSDLPDGAVDAIDRFIRVYECNGQNIESIHRADAQTVEVVWYDDAGATYDRDYYSSEEKYENARAPTRVRDSILRRVREAIQMRFGEHWVVERKPDKRRNDGRHPQRALIRRASHRRFSYEDESQADYLLHLHGRPDGVPEDVTRWEDHDCYPDTLPIAKYSPLNLYLYESGTGTVHLVDGEFLHDTVSVPQETHCSLTLEPEEMAQPETLTHYGGHLHGRYGGEWKPLPSHEGNGDPASVLGDTLCDQCRKAYYWKDTYDDGTVRRYKPPHRNYWELLDYETEEYQ